MSLPNQIDPTTPTGSSARNLGDDQIRALKQAIIDIFGLPSATDISNSLFTVNDTGAITSIRFVSSGAPIDTKYLDVEDIVNIASSFWLKGSNPNFRLIGSEGSGKDWRIFEHQGTISIDENTGAEATPTWSRRIIIGSTSGNILWYSGGSFTVELDHGATADRVVTIPDATDTLVNLSSAQTLSAKGLSGVTALSMAANIGIVPAAVSGTPAQHALFQESVVKAYARIDDASGTPVLIDSFNVTSITDTATGRVTITWDRDFANANYVVIGNTGNTSTAAACCVVGFQSADVLVGSAIADIRRSDSGALVDITDDLFVIAIGDQ